VRPSGLLPSLRLSDVGSSMAGVFADANARLMRSLTALCLKRRPRGKCPRLSISGRENVRGICPGGMSDSRKNRGGLVEIHHELLSNIMMH